jgi:hypothetical protein
MGKSLAAAHRERCLGKTMLVLGGLPGRIGEITKSGEPEAKGRACEFCGSVRRNPSCNVCMGIPRLTIILNRGRKRRR